MGCGYAHVRSHSSTHDSSAMVSDECSPYRSAITDIFFVVSVALSALPGASSVPLSYDSPSSLQISTVPSRSDTHIVHTPKSAHRSSPRAASHLVTVALDISRSTVVVQAPCMLVVQKPCTVPSLVGLLPCVTQGLEVSLSCILQNCVVQRQIGN
jgi:hypothetical protein